MASQQKNTAASHSHLRDLRTLHLEDAAAREELYDLMEDMKQRIHAAMTDSQAADGQHPRIQSLTANILAQVNEKYKFLITAESLISNYMEEEINTRERMLKLAENVLLKEETSSTSFGRNLDRFRNKLFDQSGGVELNHAKRALRDSMDVRVDLNDVLRVAEGGSQQTAIDAPQ